MTPVQSTSMTISASSEAGSGAMRDIVRRSATLLILVAFVLAVVLLARFGDIVMQRRVIYCLVNLVAVIGLYIFMGNSGVLNFSNVAFMAIGEFAIPSALDRHAVPRTFCTVNLLAHRFPPVSVR